MSTTLTAVDWIVTPWQPTGLAVGDFVEAAARADDAWFGVIRGEISYILRGPECYAAVEVDDGVVWDVDISQIKVLSGKRKVSIYLSENTKLDPLHSSHKSAAYNTMPVSLFGLRLGLLTVQVYRCDQDRPAIADTQLHLHTAVLEFNEEEDEITWEAVLPLFQELPISTIGRKEKPTEALVSLTHSGKEDWGWEQSFPLQFCHANRKVYVCVGDLDSIPDVEDMTNLEDDICQWD